MTSVAASIHHFEQQTTEIFETVTYYDPHNHQDQEMTDSDYKQIPAENGYEDQDTYNAEIESTVVEPPQSDAVLNYAPSTILDEMEYLEDEIDYEEADPKEPLEIPLIQHDFDTYKAETTTAHTPPAHSPEEQHMLLPIFSPASRMIPLPRPTTPLVSTLATTTSTTTIGEDEPIDDDWPICLYTPTGQEYMLFRSDGDTEALFEDNWLKSQPLETFFSSIRQTLENEFASLTSSFAMDEIVLAIPDLEVSIAEDNCYTREISLQDLVNLINGLCAKNGTERASTCKLQLSLQPRFIARFNQLVSLTSQTWDLSKQNVASDEPEDEIEHEEVRGEEEEGTGETVANDEEIDEDAEYEEYDNDENAEELQEEVELDDHRNRVKFQEHSEDGLTAAEEDELYEENDDDESYDQTLQSTEAVISDDDVAEEFDEHDDHMGFDDIQGEEERQEELVNTADMEPLAPVQRDREHGTGTDDDDDLISYEEAVDQTEDGQDYRQQYLNEETTADKIQNGETNQYQIADVPHINGSHIVSDEGQTDPVHNDVNAHMSDTDVSTSKRPLNEVVDPSTQNQEPPLKRTKS